MSRLVLIDGSSYLYRAFHALPPLSNAAGEPTGALFGVVNMLRATLKEKPDYVAFVVDAPGKTFRDDMYAEYKANRPPMPDELRSQVQPMCDIVHALGIDILRVPGVEADDVIGTLALAGAADGLEVTISTGDKDFAQLVRPGVVLVNTMTGSRTDSDAAVMDKFGVRAAQIVDYLALMGDTVDNVPGVEKCGPKTAAKWLAEYATLDGVMAAAPTMKGKIGENLRAALPRLPLNRDLVTIRTDVALEQGPRDLQLREQDAEALRGLYSRYGFTQALRELGGAAALPEVAEANTGSLRGTAAGYAKAADAAPIGEVDAALSAKGEYETVLSSEQLQAWLQRLHAADEFAFDTETDALDAMRANLVGISLSVEPGKGAYIPVGHDYPGAPTQLPLTQVLDALRPLLQDAAKKKLGQHGKYDIHVLRRYGIEVRGYADDTMLESFVLNSTATRHDMDSLAQRYLGYTTTRFEDVAGKGAKQISFSQVGIDEASAYAAEDADITLRLHRVLSPQLQAEPTLETVYHGHRNAAGAGAGAHRSQRRVHRQRGTAPAKRRTFHAHVGRAAKGHRVGRPHLQPRFAQAVASGVVRRTWFAGLGENAQGPAFHQRRSAGSDCRTTRTAARDSRLSRFGQTAQHLHRQVAGNGEPGDGPRAHQLPPIRRGHRAAVLAPTPTCKTSRFAPTMAAAFAAPSSPRRGASCWLAITRKSSCASWPTCLKTRA